MLTPLFGGGILDLDSRINATERSMSLMCNILKLKGKIVENGMTQEEFAKAANIDRATFNRRLKRSESFTIGEVSRIVTVLKLSEDEALSIFLPSMSHKCD